MLSMITQKRIAEGIREVRTNDGGIVVRVSHYGGRDNIILHFGALQTEFTGGQGPFVQYLGRGSLRYRRKVRLDRSDYIEVHSFRADNNEGDWVEIQVPLDPDVPASLEASRPAVTNKEYLTKGLWVAGTQTSLRLVLAFFGALVLLMVFVRWLFF